MGKKRERNRRNSRVIAADLVYGFIKNRKHRKYELEEKQIREKIEAGREITEWMKTLNVIPGNAEGNEHLTSVLKTVCSDNGSVESDLKRMEASVGELGGTGVSERGLESKSCFRLLPRGVRGRGRMRAGRKVKEIDFSYGLTIMEEMARRRAKASGVKIPEQKSSVGESRKRKRCVEGSKEISGSYEPDVPGTHGQGAFGPNREARANGRRVRKRRKTIPSSMDFYGEVISNDLMMLSENIHDWKTGASDAISTDVSKSGALEGKLEMSCIDTSSSDNMHRFQSLKRKREDQKTSEIRESATKRAKNVDTGIGEKNLMEFIRRLSEGEFFYQTEQLFFEGFQQVFMKKLISTLAPMIVGPAWTSIGPRICKKMGWTKEDLHLVVCAVAPRRTGKSVAVAVIALALALVLSPCEITIFSTCGRVSGFLHEKIKDIAMESGFGDWIHNIGKEHIYLLNPNDPNDQLRKIFSYPSNPDQVISERIRSFCTENGYEYGDDEEERKLKSRKYKNLYLMRRGNSEGRSRFHTRNPIKAKPPKFPTNKKRTNRVSKF